MATRLISNLIMARLLFPEAFGIVVAAVALITGLTLVSDFGIPIIQSPRGDGTYGLDRIAKQTLNTYQEAIDSCGIGRSRQGAA
jgi:hypothetical protein